MTARKGLSANQAAIYSFVRDYMTQNPWCPTVKEIQEGCGISSASVVTYNLWKLSDRGLVDWRPDGTWYRTVHIVGARYVLPEVVV